MSEEWAPGLFFIGLLVLVADSCDGRSSSRQASVPAQEQFASSEAGPSESGLPWDDCEPGAPPASLANALDVLDARCDPARALAIVASVGAMALPGGAARGAVVRSAGSRAAMSRAGSAGAAVDGVIMSEGMAARTPRASRDYRVTPAPREGYEVSLNEEGSAGRAPYQVEAVDEARYRVSPPRTARDVTVEVDRARDAYTVKPGDHPTYQVRGRRVRDDETSNETQVWEYKPE